MPSNHLAIPWALENSSPCSILRCESYSIWTYQNSSTSMTMGVSAVATMRTWSYCESQLLRLQCNFVGAGYVFHSRKFFWCVWIEWSSKSFAWVTAVGWMYVRWVTVCSLPWCQAKLSAVLLSPFSLVFLSSSPSSLVSSFVPPCSFFSSPPFLFLALSFPFPPPLLFPFFSSLLFSFPFSSSPLSFVIPLSIVAFPASNWNSARGYHGDYGEITVPNSTSIFGEWTTTFGWISNWIRDTSTSTSAISEQLSMEPTGPWYLYYIRSSFVPTVYDDSSGTTRFVPTSFGPVTTKRYSCTFMAPISSKSSPVSHWSSFSRKSPCGFWSCSIVGYSRWYQPVVREQHAWIVQWLQVQGLVQNFEIGHPFSTNRRTMGNWWQNQPEAAESTIHRVAVCLGISPGKIKSGQNENLLKVMTVALTMSS